MAGELPVGFDRADGLSGRIGTATPAGSILFQTTSGAMTIDDVPIEEMPDSPDIERAEQATISKTYRMSWQECLNRIAFIGRGTYAEDSFGNGYLVLSCSIKHEHGGTGLMTLVMEAKTFDAPPDEFSIVPVELGVNILKHPRYFYAFLGTGYGSVEEQQNQMVIRLLQDYFENTSANYRAAIIQMLKDSASLPAGAGTVQPPHWNSDTQVYDDGSLVSGTSIAKAAALEIVQKWWRGEETPYLVGYEMTWTQYYFVSPFINPGGYIEDPMTESSPQLPEYFYSRVFPPDSGQTIFDYLPAINPQCYSSDGTDTGAVNISWLRKADQVEYQRTWFRKTMTWIGSPVGQWDIDLYTKGARPSGPSGYRTVS